MGAEQVQVWTLPFRRNLFFTGREELLARLHAYLHSQQPVFVSQPAALSGLGGVGKTQIAIEYAYRYANEYRYVFWVRADTTDTLTTDFLTLAHRLQLPERDARDQTITVEGVKHWLEEHSGWLLLFDNADEISLIDPFLPTRVRGHLLITTRTHPIGGRAHRIEIADMDREEGARFLLRRIGMLAPDTALSELPEPIHQVTLAIVEALDGLPLALDQAGAYIEETGCGLPRFLDLYQTRRRAVLARRSKHPSDHPEPVATTWSLSFKRIEQVNPTAAELLRCCAFLHPDTIPEELLIKSVAHLSPQLQQAVGDPVHFDEAIGELLTYSLLRRLPETGNVSIHRLVQAVLQDDMDQATQRRWAETILQALDDLFPFGEFENWERCQRYLPHAMRCAEYIEQWHLVSLQAAWLLHNVASYLIERAQYPEAEPLYQRALDIWEQVQGPEHPDTAATLEGLGILYRRWGKYERAEPLYQRALAIKEQVLGPEHPDTAGVLNNLANLYYNRGKYEQAEPLYQRALDIWEQVQGPEHPSTARALDNLAILYRNQGKYKQAEPLYQRALAIREKVLGPAHPETAQTLNNLAILYSNQGKDEQAEPLYQRALVIKEKVLGPEHPSTASTLDNLAILYRHQGKYEQAEPLYQRALAIREKVLGPEHPETLRTLRNYTIFLRKVGRDQEAARLEAQIEARKAKERR